MVTKDSCQETKLPITMEDNKRVNLLQRAQWLRAAILGANDGLLSTTSLMLGVGAAKEGKQFMIISGLAGALAGACSMAVGEFVSVSTQRDIEKKTKGKSGLGGEFSTNGDLDHNVIVQISGESVKIEDNLGMKKIGDLKMSPAYVCPSPRSSLVKVLVRDAENDRKHEIREDNSMDEVLPNPYKAAAASGISFLCGSLVPLVATMAFSQDNVRAIAIVFLTSIALAIFGGVGARLGGSSVMVSAMRVLIGGWISMAVTYGLLKPLDRDDH